MAQALDDSEDDANYQFFRSIVGKIMTPADATQQLRRLGVPPDRIQRIVERHQEECRRIRELDEPRSVYAGSALGGWYTGPAEGDRNWPALKKSLQAKVGDGANLNAIDKASMKIVELLDHPKQPKFSSRGLVVGYVQSGKTTSFTSVIAKAADSGYKLFIVLSGIHNALRRQTQIRLYKDLIAPNPDLWHEVTTADHDFNLTANAAGFLSAKDQHLLLVVKKNASVLRKLRDWLGDASGFLENCPTLIIDDEADQSTVATKKINPLLNDVIGKFPKVGYIGYTATPFANLLIDPSLDHDFYPRDFIVNLPQPEGHQGTEVLFGREPFDWEDAEDVPGGFDMIRAVPDDDVNDLKPANMKEAASFTPAITPSLEAAVRWFWLATAARRVRGTGNPHSTMLIHTSVNSGVHLSFVPLLEHLRKQMTAWLASSEERVLEELRKQWDDETSRVKAPDFDEDPVAFETLLEHLPAVVGKTKIIVDNYRSKDRLDYDSGPATAIAVGGNTLSRGLTLEGLVCSLFVRGASAYDTLLQMGRWFGYRDGYADLPRIWMTAELQSWFRHLATVEAEMRLDIDRYLTTNETPMSFAVRLRSHPKMLITAKAKMRAAVKAEAAYGGHLVESRYFDVRPEGVPVLQANADAAKALIERAAVEGHRNEDVGDNRALFEDVPHRFVLDFLNAYEFHPESAEADRRKLVAYIDKRLRAGALTRWNVGVIGSNRNDAQPYEDIPGSPIGMVRRGRIAKIDGTAADAPADIKTLTSARDTTIDLRVTGDTEPKRSEAEKLRKKQLPDVGLLLLYPIDPKSDTQVKGREPLDAAGVDVVMGAALLFPQPGTGPDDKVEFEYWSAALVEQDDDDAIEGDEEDE